jgi:hypothetical protein
LKAINTRCPIDIDHSYPELKNEIKSNQLERERSTSHRTTPARFRVRSKSSGDIPPNPRTMSGIVVRRLADSVTLSRRGDALTVSKLPSFIDSTNRKLLSADAASVVVGSMIRSVAPGACDAFTPTPVQRECWAWLLDSSPPDTVAIAVRTIHFLVLNLFGNLIDVRVAADGFRQDACLHVAHHD